MAFPVEKAIVPFSVPKAETPPATAFRSTWLTSSIRALRERALLDRYLAALPRTYHDAVLSAVGVWLPIEVALAHYAACEALSLTIDEQIEIGKTVTTFAHKSSYAFVLRLATDAGVTPWACFAAQKRLWLQVWRGGDVAIFEVGPKEARVEIVGWPCAGSEYIRNAMLGVLIGQTQLFCQKAYAHRIHRLCSSTALGFRVSWV